MKNVIILILLSIFALSSPAYSEDASRPSDGVYVIGNITINFKPPSGWELVKKDSALPTQINFQPKSADFSATSLGIVASPVPAQSGFDIENLMKMTEKDSTISDREIIDFLDTKAFSSITELSGLRTKSIQFLKAGNIFTIIFMADNNEFDKLLPGIEDSLKTFQIASSAPVVAMPPIAEPAPALANLSVPIAPAPLPVIAEPFHDIAQTSSVVKILLKSGTIVKGKVLTRTDRCLKVDFHGVPINVYFSDINSIEEGRS